MERKIIDKISNIIDLKSEEIINFTKSMVGELSENPPGDETAVAGLIKSQAIKWSLPEPKIWSKKDNRPNLIFGVEGNNGGKTLIFNGHMDTKPIGDTSKWSIDPYNPSIKNGKLYGRGSTDMKSGIAGILAAAMSILNSSVSFKGNIILAITADEECGSAYGARVLVEKGLKGDAVLIAEPSGMKKDFDSLGVACRGALLGKIIVHGTQMHSSISDQGGCINPSVKMAKVIVEFSENLKNYLNYKPHYLYPNGPTINPGVTLGGGISYGVIPGDVNFGFDIRIIPGMDIKTLVRDIENFLKKLRDKDTDLKAELVLEEPPLDNLPPAEIKRDHPMVLSCIDMTEEVTGLKPNLLGVPFSTDAIYLANQLNIPTIPSFGPGLIRLAHAPDEYVEVKAIIDSAKIFALSALEYLNKY
jgi:acetylornithine deacetylase